MSATSGVPGSGHCRGCWRTWNVPSRSHAHAGRIEAAAVRVKRRSMRSKAVGGDGVDAQAVGRGGRSAGEGAANRQAGRRGRERSCGFLVGAAGRAARGTSRQSGPSQRRQPQGRAALSGAQRKNTSARWNRIQLVAMYLSPPTGRCRPVGVGEGGGRQQQAAAARRDLALLVRGTRFRRRRNRHSDTASTAARGAGSRPRPARGRARNASRGSRPGRPGTSAG